MYQSILEFLSNLPGKDKEIWSRGRVDDFLSYPSLARTSLLMYSIGLIAIFLNSTSLSMIAEKTNQ